jgi:hypothetical protein
MLHRQQLEPSLQAAPIRLLVPAQTLQLEDAARFNNTFMAQLSAHKHAQALTVRLTESALPLRRGGLRSRCAAR